MAESAALPEGPAAFPEGVPCWVDAQLADVAAGKRFYGELFGWTFEGATTRTNPGLGRWGPCGRTVTVSP